MDIVKKLLKIEDPKNASIHTQAAELITDLREFAHLLLIDARFTPNPNQSDLDEAAKKLGVKADVPVKTYSVPKKWKIRVPPKDQTKFEVMENVIKYKTVELIAVHGNYAIIKTEKELPEVCLAEDLMLTDE
jgi:hypothetical protein